MLRFFLRPTKDRRSISALDYKLVKQAQNGGLPSPAQIKYLFRFLSTKEKNFFFLFFFTAIFGALSLFGVFVSKHISLVPAEGGEYSEALIGQPKYINPIYASINDVDQDLASLTYSGLFRFNDNQILEPDIAESFSISTDTKSYLIKIKTGVKFADNQPLTANDVVYTFDLIQNPEVASPLSAAFHGVKVEKISEFEVKFTLKEPFAPFLDSLTVGILPEHIWSEISPNGIRLAKNNLQPAGAGPWQFGKIIKDATGRIDSITLNRNEYYFKNKPFIRNLRFKFFDEYGSAIEALKSQNVDTLSFIPNYASLKLNNKNLNFFDLRFPEYTALFFNQTFQPFLKDSDLRLALLKALDKNYLSETVLSGHATPIDSPFLPGSLGYSPDLKKITFNPSDANTLLDKKWTRLQPEEYFTLRRNALIKELGINKPTSTIATSTMNADDEKRISDIIRSEMEADQPFYRRDKDNNILQLNITTADTEEYGKVANEIAKYWKKVGIRTTIERTNAGRLLRDSVKNRTYDVLLYSEITGSDPDPYPFWHSSQIDYPGLNLSGFSDRNADKLLEDSRVTVDPKIRAENYLKFQNILIDEVPAIFLYTPWHSMAVNKEVKGVNVSVLNVPTDRFSGLSNWYLKTKFKWK
ncbi:MAG: peptide ABC transporter substrate-binding protein [Patescibacteria group bacterium]|jgi:peptide/nickel transport system substrate-binding protein